MGRTVSIGAQNFADVREGDYFLVDKTDFIRQWWEGGDPVTLICRPRRFGKTLNMSMVECFLSTKYAGRGDELFGGLSIWEDSGYRQLQGTVPVISVSFADCKGATSDTIFARMRSALRAAVEGHGYVLSSDRVATGDRAFLARVSDDMDDATAAGCLQALCNALLAHWGVRPVILLDEYDTPMQEAWLKGAWDQAVEFQRPLFNATFKTNPALGRGLITGVTRVSRESIFSDLNNLAIVTTTTPKYETSFGFTENEVFSAMDEMGLHDKPGVKAMYDGFVFGGVSGIYNPWSVTSYLDDGRLLPFWANSSGNALVSRLISTGGPALQNDFETLMAGGSIQKNIDEQVVFDELGRKKNAIWSLLLAAGYVKADKTELVYGEGLCAYLSLVNTESRMLFDDLISGWLDDGAESYSEFVSSLLADDLESCEQWLSDLLVSCISTFDGGVSAGGTSAPENFYHGLVLGLLVDLRGRYEVTSNRESGYGRYDVMLAPLNEFDFAFVLEFKVFNPRRERTLEDTLTAAHSQIEERDYDRQLQERGIALDRIRHVAFAFKGKEALVG